MANFGQMKSTNEGKLGGHLLTFQHSVRFALRPIPHDERQSEKAPSFEIHALAPHGEWVQVGAAWDHEMRRGDFIGESMFRLWFDDPAFGEGLSVSAFPANNDGDYRLTIDRKKKDSEPGGQSQSAPNFDDNVPF